MSCDGRACFRKGFRAPPADSAAAAKIAIPVHVTANGSSAPTNARRPPSGAQSMPAPRRIGSDSNIASNMARRGNGAQRAMKASGGAVGTGGLGTMPLTGGSPAAVALNARAANVARSFDVPLFKVRAVADGGVEVFKGRREDPADRVAVLAKDSVLLVVERTGVNGQVWLRGVFVDPVDASLKEGWVHYAASTFWDAEPLRLMQE